MQLGYEVFHEDVRALVDFYVEVLGFAVSAADPPPDHVVVRRGTVAVGCTWHPEAVAVDRRPPQGSEIVLRVRDIRREYEQVVASGWPIADQLQQRPWGLIDFRMFDPSGQYLRITATAPG